jgi:hypothetical protein
LGSVIHLFAERRLDARPSRIRPELDKFNETRCLMLEAFTALTESGMSRADLTDEMLSTIGAMRGLRDLLAKDAANAR